MAISSITTPIGTTGLAVEPWSKGEIYAVAANWAQASSPVMVYGLDGWDIHESGLQVADFRHNTKEALRDVIERTIVASGDDVEDTDVDGIVDDATEIGDGSDE